MSAEFTSEHLTSGTVYTRKELSSLFSVTDATINTGVFRPKGTSSVWLFVTEQKTADRTQYHDRLDGETLYWQGQTSGRTDSLVIEHRLRGVELLVFFRKRKDEYPGGGFRYIGPFNYSSHSGSGPTSFILKHVPEIDPIIAAEEADTEAFDPANVEDARQRIMRSIAQRRGQKAFRDTLFKAYEGQCAVTECSVPDVLEAAHIHPYRGPETNKVGNGLLLRADIHTLFDCGLLAVDHERMTLLVAPQLRDTEYGTFHGRKLRTPRDPRQRPNKDALKLHRVSVKL
jgi:hypothetical protein